MSQLAYCREPLFALSLETMFARSLPQFRYLHLLGHPSLLRFCLQEQIAITTYTKPYGQLKLIDIAARGIPKKSGSDFRERRIEINRCLRFGYRHCLLDKNRRRRLTGDNATQFWAIISEMKVGIWLETQNIKIEDFEPPAANGRIGDYRIKKGSRIASRRTWLNIVLIDNYPLSLGI